MSEWKEYKLGEIINLIGGGTPKTSITEYWNGGIPWLSVTDFNTDRKYVYSAEKSITELGLEKSSTKILKKGQVIISARGTVGVVAMLGNNMAFNQSNYGIDAIEDITENNFLYYLLKNTVPQFLSNSYGAVFNTITKTTFDYIEIKLPPLPEQKAIAEVLSSLDDKIDLLHRQNKTLEQMAETLFRQWFTPPSPLKGDKEKSPSGDLGAYESWEEKPLEEYFELLGGFAFKSKNYSEFGKYKVVTIKSVQDGYLETSSASAIEILPEKIKAYQILTFGDILLSLTGNVGRVCLVDEDNCLLNQRVAKIKSKNFDLKPFAYFYFRQPEMIERLTYLSKGSAQLNLSPVETLKQIDVFPNNERLEKFSEVVLPIFDKILVNKIHIRTLKKMRDTLLPKLMSGEVRVNI